jgi:hypothetical protein
MRKGDAETYMVCAQTRTIDQHVVSLEAIEAKNEPNDFKFGRPRQGVPKIDKLTGSVAAFQGASEVLLSILLFREFASAISARTPCAPRSCPWESILIESYQSAPPMLCYIAHGSVERSLEMLPEGISARPQPPRGGVSVA